jgi:thiol-disulfide isomerase/thioredoxin
MRIFLLSFVAGALLFMPFSSAAQQAKLYPFTLSGTINADTGKIKLEIISDTAFYPKQFRQMETRVVNGKFSFSGYLPYPMGVTLDYSAYRYNSAVFVIEQGDQSVNCNIDSSRKIPQITNRVMHEYVEYQNAFSEYKRNYDLQSQKWHDWLKQYQNNIPENLKLDYMKQVKAGYATHDSILLKYVTNNPNSYVAFWNFVNLNVFGYENIFDPIYASFSDSLKNTYSGKALGLRLKFTGTLAIGKKFKYVTGIDDSNKQLDSDFFKHNKYTLVDFWYSHCGPCRAQFPDLRNVYARYENKGLQIIGISTDKTADKNDWKKAIKEDKLAWPQYWDVNGIESSKVYVVVFPTNFLLDNNGVIIKKDVSPVELADFLRDNLK